MHRHARGAELERVTPPDLERPRPSQKMLVRIRVAVTGCGSCASVASSPRVHVDLLRERESRGLAGADHGRRDAVERLERLDARPLARRMEHHLVADAQPAAVDRAGDDAAIVAVVGELEDGLHRHPERSVHRLTLAPESVEHLEHRRSGVPRHRRRSRREIVAVASDHRDDRRGLEPDGAEERAEVARRTRRNPPAGCRRDPSC